MTKNLITEIARVQGGPAAGREFDCGDTAWTPNGAKVKVQAQTISGHYVVAPIHESYDGEEITGALALVDRLFDHAPIAVISEEFTKISAAVAAKKIELRDLERSILDFTGEHRKRVEALKRFKALERVEDWIDGKFSYVVTTDGYGSALKVFTTSDVLKGGAGDQSFSRDLKLITLFGKSNGDLQWRVNAYYDGNGAWKDCWFFQSEEEATRFIHDHQLELLNQALEVAKIATDPAVVSISEIVLRGNAAVAAGVELNAEQEAFVTGARRRVLIAKRDALDAAARKSLDEAKAIDEQIEALIKPAA